MNIVITGGTSGIGKALVEKYFNQGDNIIILARSVEEGEINKTNTNFVYGIKCDLASKVEIDSAFKIIGERFEKIDLIINNAGYGVSGATELISENEARRIFDVNFYGTLFCIQNALPLMQAGARIFNISSACALFALPFRTLYCASKSAVSMLSDSIRLELIKAGIYVSAICPGDIKTNFTKNRVKNFETNQRYENRIQSATDNIDKREDKRMSLEFASAKIFKITQKPKPKPQYIIGGKYKLLYFLSKIFPKNIFLKATNSLMGGK